MTTYANTPEEMEALLTEREWGRASFEVIDRETVFALICPLCSALVPPKSDDPAVDHRAHHIRYHVALMRMRRGGGQ